MKDKIEKTLPNINKIDYFFEKKISPVIKFTIISTFALTFIVHADMIFSPEQIFNADTLTYGIYRDDYAWAWDFALARWGLWLLTIVFSNSIFLPTFYTILGIVSLAITAAFLVDLFEVKTKLVAFLVGGLLVTYPVLSYIFPLSYYAFSYCLGAMSAVISAWVVAKTKSVFGIIVGAVFLIFGLSVYQSNLLFSVIPAMFWLVFIICTKDMPIKEFVIKIFRQIGMILSGFTAYLVLTFFILNIKNLQLDPYRGANSFWKYDFSNLIVYIKGGYSKVFSHYFSKGSMELKQAGLPINFLFIILGILFCVILFLLIKNANIKLINKRIAHLVAVLFILLLPIFIALFDIAMPSSGGGGVNSMFHYVLPIIFVIVMAEKLPPDIWNSLIQNVAVICCVLITISSAVFTNISYYSTKINTTGKKTTAITILSRIESIEGYTVDTPVLFDGIYAQNENIAAREGLYGGLRDMLWDWTSWYGYYEMYLGVKLKIPEEKYWSSVKETQEYKDMGLFPDYSSVKMIDGIIVVKMKQSL